MSPSTRTLLFLAVVAVLSSGCALQADSAARFEVDASARPGGTLRVAITEPASIDPQNVFDDAGRLVVSTICDTLLTLDPLTGELLPGLASSWQITDRGRSITLQLRRDLKFSDGSSVTAEDIQFSLTRAASEEYAGANADLLRPIVGFEVVHGDAQTNDDDRKRRLDGVQLVGNSIRITWSSDRADLVRLLTHPIAAPVSSKGVRSAGDDFDEQPICAGPYELEAPWKRGDTTIRLVRSRSYRDANPSHSRGGAGYADVVEFILFPDAGAAFDAFVDGAVDVAGVPREKMPEVERPDATLTIAPAPGVEYIGMRVGAVNVFASRTVRQALALALDRETVAAVFGRTRLAAVGFIPPTSGDALSSRVCAEALPPRGDVARAVDMLAREGHDLRNQKVVFTYNDELDNRLIVEEAARQWSNAFGLDIDLQPMSWDAYLEAATSRVGLPGLFRESWVPAYESPDRYLVPFTSAAIGGDNWSGYDNREFELQLERVARRRTDEAERAAAYRRLQDRLCGEMPMIPVLHPAEAWILRSSTVEAALASATHRSTGLVNLRDLYLVRRPA